MTWEESILFIRDKPEWQQIVDGCYFDADLVKNIERFRSGAEFKETLRILGKYICNDTPKLLDVGAGNGIAALSFAIEGFDVVALEPDPSSTIGSGAIEILKEHYKLPNLRVTNEWGEKMPFENDQFDIVYARQVMHHAYHLGDFVKEAHRVVRRGGIYFANRDHIANDEKQLAEFLNIHPLHKYYGGENAYSLQTYKTAITNAGFKILKEYGHLDNVILTDKVYEPDHFKQLLSQKIGSGLSSIGLLVKLFKYYLNKKNKGYTNVAGRVHSFICMK